MTGRRILLYFAWSRPGETHAPIEDIDDRFPALFELRRLFYPRFEEMADPDRYDQGIAGFLDHVQKPNFAGFAELAESLTGQPVTIVERALDDGIATPHDDRLLAGFDTVIVISFDSFRTAQQASQGEIEAVERFLADPDHLLCLSPHHDIGEAEGLEGEARIERQTADFLHHGDKAIPPRQGFGGFARSLAAGLGVPVENRFGLRPAITADGAPAPIEADPALDDLGLLAGVATFNLHPHLPQLERIGDSLTKMQVLARQPIDPAAPPHPFTRGGRTSFDALLQSAPETFAGRLLVSDTTLWSSTAGGVDSLRRFWSNVAERSRRS